MSEDYEDMVAEKEEYRSHEEPRRIKYAIGELMDNRDRLNILKVEQMGASRLDIYLKQGIISLFPFTGWFAGRNPFGKIKGRGIVELIKELEKIK